jgi:hypothetical protein
VTSRSLTRAQKLARALRACHRKRSKRRRITCERQVHRRYGVRAAARHVTPAGSGARLATKTSGR